MKKYAGIVLLGVCLALLIFTMVPTPKPVLAQSTNPPQYGPGQTISACYDDVNGAVRFVKPWGVAGASVANCTPPAQWQVPGVAYDPTFCNAGGQFDCRKNELYTQLLAAP